MMATTASRVVIVEALFAHHSGSVSPSATATQGPQYSGLPVATVPSTAFAPGLLQAWTAGT